MGWVRDGLEGEGGMLTEPGSTEFWMRGRIREWYLTDSCLREWIRDESSVRMACFIRCSSPELSHSGGSKDKIWSEKGAIYSVVRGVEQVG